MSNCYTSDSVFHILQGTFHTFKLEKIEWFYSNVDPCFISSVFPTLHKVEYLVHLLPFEIQGPIRLHRYQHPVKEKRFNGFIFIESGVVKHQITLIILRLCPCSVHGNSVAYGIHTWCIHARRRKPAFSICIVLFIACVIHVWKEYHSWHLVGLSSYFTIAGFLSIPSSPCCQLFDPMTSFHPSLPCYHSLNLQVCFRSTFVVLSCRLH